ncbi:MAG: tetratricopeptide repeat protein [Pseudomonadales bacterium]
MTKVRYLLLLATLISLGGCATHLHSSSQSEHTPAQYQPGQLNGTTIVDILSAELAARDNQLPYSLQKYLKQAELTKDAGIAQRAARIAQHLRDSDALFRAVELWLNADSDAVEANQIMANLLLHQGDFEKAQKHFKYALNQGRKQMLILLSSERQRMSKAELRSYITLLDTVEKTADLAPALLLSKGLLQRQLGELQSALKSFDAALALNADLPTAVFQKADTLKALKSFTKALNVVEAYLKKNPKDRQFSALQVQLLYLEEKSQRALQITDQLIADNPSDQQLINYLALTAFDFEHYEKSAQLLQKLLQLSPSKTSPHYFLGLISERQQDTAKAITHYERVDSGDNALAAHNRAVYLHRSDEDITKIAQLTASARQRMPNETVNLTITHAEWLHRQKRSALAIDLLSKQIALHPKSTELLYSRAMYTEPDNFAAAEQDFKRILDLDPDNAVVLNAFGYTLTIHTQRFEEAHTLIARALELSPEDPATLDSMGWVLFKLQRVEEALEYLNRAFDAYQDPEVASHLISALASINRLDDAKKIYEQMNASHPNNKFMDEARLVIEKSQ